MSGGVDSSVAAALLIEEGWRVEAVSLRLWDAPERGDRICSNWHDAGRVAKHLGIPHHILDRRALFEREVVTPFVDGYADGQTPNPCMACNSRFKLGELLDWAQERGAQKVATGHYARITMDRGRPVLCRGHDPARDQSYFLFELGEEQLEKSLFPVGHLTKSEVRAHARRLDIPVADKLESQDLCFGRPADLVAMRGRGRRAGEIVNQDGRTLGRHSGIEHFTIGQRRGLGVSGVAPLYVQGTDPETARVFVADTPPSASTITVRDFRLISSGTKEGEVQVQIRHRQEPIPAVVEEISGSRARIRFDSAVFAATPGQAAVAYRGDSVVGGGWIESVGRREA
jgi:tRNA-specific 2-thiouridylase